MTSPIASSSTSAEANFAVTAGKHAFIVRIGCVAARRKLVGSGRHDEADQRFEIAPGLSESARNPFQKFVVGRRIRIAEIIGRVDDCLGQADENQTRLAMAVANIGLEALTIQSASRTLGSLVPGSGLAAGVPESSTRSLGAACFPVR